MIRQRSQAKELPELRALREAQKAELDAQMAKLGEERKKLEDELEKEIIKWGAGRVITSGTVVTGEDTAFLREAKVGDFLVTVQDGQEHERRIKMVLSDQSVGVESPFPTDCAIGVRYKLKTWRKTETETATQREGVGELYKRRMEAVAAEQSKRETKRVEKLKLGRVKIEKAITRTEEAVEQRRKQKHDRHAY